MTDQGRTVVEGTARLNQALEQAAKALTTADLDALLQSEASLELALKRMKTPGSLANEDRVAIRAQVDITRQTLVRCRRLGDVLLDVVRLTLEAQGRTTGYGRPDATAAAYGPRSVNTTG